MRWVRLCLLLSGTTLLLAGLRGQAAHGPRPLPEWAMRDLIGGVCNTRCQNACQTQAKCGECLKWQNEGELCPGGGGGTGTAFRCVSARPSSEESLVFECFLQGGDSKCTPDKICTCDNAKKPVCTERNNKAEVAGNGACVTGTCSSK